MLKEIREIENINNTMKAAGRGRSEVYVYIVQAAWDEDGRSGRDEGFWKAALLWFSAARLYVSYSFSINEIMLCTIRTALCPFHGAVFHAQYTQFLNSLLVHFRI